MDVFFGIFITLGSIAIPVAIYALYRKGILFQRLDWAVYLLAVAVAFFLWEMPVTSYLFLAGEEADEFAEMSVAAGLAFAAFISLSASLWDGGIIVAGLLLVRQFVDGPHFQHFRVSEAAIIILWGVAFAFLVETLAVVFGLWEYPVYWWNPALFSIQGRNVVFCATLGWAPIALIFYQLILWMQQLLHKRSSRSASA